MCADSIDFANSRSDSYTASNSSVMDELNSYFKSYIAGHVSSNDMTLDEAADEIFRGAGFDDAMDMINRDAPVNSSSSSSSDEEDGDRINGIDESIDTNTGQNLLDVEILDQHIDKAGITGGSDATRAIENMAGGGKNNADDLPDDADVEPTSTDGNSMSEFASAMLGGSVNTPHIDTTGPVRGYSGVTSEIRIKGNRVTERDRNGSNYLTEDGYIDAQSMLGGGGSDNDDDHDQNDHQDDGYPEHGVIETIDSIESHDHPIAQGPATEETEEVDTIVEVRAHAYSSGSSSDSSSDSESYSDDGEVEDEDDTNHNMASEIDHVLNQLRNKTARTLTGGTVNIRKKVVLTDMYPYIIRT